MGKNLNQIGMDAAVLAMLSSGLLKPKEKSPKDDPSWIKLNQLYRLNLSQLQKAQFAESAAREAKFVAVRIVGELRAQMDILASDLGIDLEEDDSNE
jgi:hypothetical protein